MRSVTASMIKYLGVLWLVALFPRASISHAETSEETRSETKVPKSHVGPFLAIDDIVEIFQFPNDQIQLMDNEAADESADPPLIPLDVVIPQHRRKVLDPNSANPEESFGPQLNHVIDHRNDDGGVRDQGKEGTCTSFAVVAAMEHLIHARSGLSVDLSERDHWNHYQRYSAEASLRAAQIFNITTEELWPYAWQRLPRGYRAPKGIAEITHYQEINPDKKSIYLSLLANKPVVIGLGVNKSLAKPGATGVVQAGFGTLGGHAMEVSGVVIDRQVPGGGYMITRNSWGTKYGNNGYAYIPLNYCEYQFCATWSVIKVAYNRP